MRRWTSKSCGQSYGTTLMTNATVIEIVSIQILITWLSCQRTNQQRRHNRQTHPNNHSGSNIFVTTYMLTTFLIILVLSLDSDKYASDSTSNV